MKQKKLNNILYVFDVNPYEITQDTDAEVIKVQEESYKGFVEMNQSLAEKIVKYNYHTMCVNVPEWAPYVEQEDPQGSLTFGIYGTGAENAINQIQVQNADNVILQSWVAGVDLSFPFQTDVEEGQHIALECKEGISDVAAQFGVTGMEYLPVRWVNEETGRTWYATSPITDSISIGIENASPAEITVTAPYGLTIYDEPQNTWVDTYQDGENPELEHGNLVVGRTYSVDKREIGQGKVVVFNPECGTGSQGTVGPEFIAPETDLVITLADAPVSTYKFILEGGDIHQNVTIKINNEPASFPTQELVEGVQVNDGDVIDVYPTGNVADYALQSGAVWDTDHWTATVNGANVDIWINYLGTGVNFNAGWAMSAAPENVSQINIGSTPVTGSQLTDGSWTDTVRLYPGTSEITFFVSTGLPTDMEKFKIDFEYQENGGIETEHHFAYKQTDPDTGVITYTDASDASGNTITNPGTWTYNNTPETGLPYITFTFPSTNKNGNAWADNTEIKIMSSVSGS